MPGIKQWKTEEILFVLDQHRKGRAVADILQDFKRLWPNISRVVDYESIKYAYGKYKDDPEYNQDWAPDQVAYVLGHKAAKTSHSTIIHGIERHWPRHVWPQRVLKDRCIEFIQAKHGKEPQYNRVWDGAEINFILALKNQRVTHEEIVRQFRLTWPTRDITSHNVIYVCARYWNHPAYQHHFRKMTQGVITEEGGDAAYAGSVAAGSKMAPVTPLGVWDDNQYLEASMTNEFVPNMETLDDYLQNAPHVSNMANISRAIQPWETVPNISEGIQYIQSPEPLPNINRGFTPPQPLFMDSSNAGITYIPYRTPFYTDEVFQTLDRQLLSPQSLTELTNVRITDPFFTDHSSVLPDSFSLVQGVFDPSQKAETNFTQDSSGDSFLTNAIDNAAENVSAGSCTSAFNEELPQRDYNCFPHHEFCNCRAERNSAAARAGEGAESKDTAERDFFTEYMNNAKNDLNFGE